MELPSLGQAAFDSEMTVLISRKFTVFEKSGILKVRNRGDTPVLAGGSVWAAQFEHRFLCVVEK